MRPAMRPSIAVSLLAATVIVTIPAHGQARFGGVTAGATLSDFGSTSSNSRWGFTGGVTAGMRNFNWSVTSIEVTYTQRGAEGIRLDYIDVPLLFGGSARLGSGSGRSRFYAGIMVGFKIGCSASTVATAACSDARGTTWGLPFGVQLGSYKTGGTFVALDVRYTLGLNDAFSNIRAYNRGWTFKAIVGRQR